MEGGKYSNINCTDPASYLPNSWLMKARHKSKPLVIPPLLHIFPHRVIRSSLTRTFYETYEEVSYLPSMSVSRNNIFHLKLQIRDFYLLTIDFNVSMARQ